MKNITLEYWAVCAALVVSLGGCAQVSAAEQATDQDTSTLQPGQTEVYGKIRSALGNEIQLVIGTPREEGRPGGRQERSQAPGETAALDADASWTTEADAVADTTPAEEAADTSGSGQTNGEGRGNRQRPGQSGEGEGAPGDGGPPDRDFSGGNRGGNRGGSMSGSMALAYTGEEETFQIPVTAAITSGQGEEAKTIRFTQLAEKNIVRLVLDDEGTVLSVQVRG